MAGQPEGYVPSVNKAASGSPVQLERARAVGHGRAIEAKSLVGGLGSREFDKAITSITVRETRRCQLHESWRLQYKVVKLVTYPEFLSRITLTFTVSPAAERKTPLMKFSSIHGSSSPILKLLIMARYFEFWVESPECGLGLLLAGRAGGGRDAHVTSGGSAIGKRHLPGGRAAVGRESVVVLHLALGKVSIVICS